MDQLNDYFGEGDTPQELHVVPRHTVRKNVLAGDWAIVVDMKQWFDQMPLSSSIQSLFCFDGGDMGPCCLTRLAMGQRQRPRRSPHSGHNAALRLPGRGVAIDYAADNVRFVGSQQSVMAAFRVFLSRFRQLGVQLNEIDTSDFDNEEKLSLLTQRYGFLGETYDQPLVNVGGTWAASSDLQQLNLCVPVTASVALCQTRSTSSPLMFTYTPQIGPNRARLHEEAHGRIHLLGWCEWRRQKNAEIPPACRCVSGIGFAYRDP